MENYLFNIFLTSITPVLYVIIFTTIITVLLFPLLKKVLVEIRKPIESENNKLTNLYLSNYNLLVKTIWAIAGIACLTIVALNAASPRITPENTTFDKSAYIEQLNTYNNNVEKKANNITDSEITTEGARVIMDQSKEEREEEFNETMDYTEPMYKDSQ